MSEEKKKKNQVLLAYDWCGENPVSFYFIEDAPDWLLQCNGSYINGTRDEKLNRLLSLVYDAITERADYRINEESELSGAWCQCKIDTEKKLRIRGKFSVVCTGFLP